MPERGMKIKNLALLSLVAIFAAGSGFVLHVLTTIWLPDWLTSRMAGEFVASSWDVRHVAAITSIEYAVGCMILYALFRKAAGDWSMWLRVFVFVVLILATRGLLVRQPLMDWLIGNPIDVVLVQNGLKALVWVITAGSSALGIEWISGRNRGPEI